MKKKAIIISIKGYKLLEKEREILRNEKPWGLILFKRNINNLKVMLANEATKILHGKVASKKAEQTAKETFQEGGFGKELPEIKVTLNEIKKGVNILDFLSKNQIMSSKSEARRAVNSKGLKINNVLIEDEKKIIDLNNFKNKVLKLSYGKKRHYLIRII